MTAQDLLKRASGSAAPDWTPARKARGKQKPTPVTPRGRTRFSPVAKRAAVTAAPAPSPEQIAKAREREDQIAKGREIRIAKASADLAITLAKADHLRASLRAMERLADGDGFTVNIVESSEPVINYSHEEAVAAGLIEAEE